MQARKQLTPSGCRVDATIRMPGFGSHRHPRQPYTDYASTFAAVECSCRLGRGCITLDKRSARPFRNVWLISCITRVALCAGCVHVLHSKAQRRRAVRAYSTDHAPLQSPRHRRAQVRSTCSTCSKTRHFAMSTHQSGLQLHPLCSRPNPFVACRAVLRRLCCVCASCRVQSPGRTILCFVGLGSG